jgi:hypothetical protein
MPSFSLASDHFHPTIFIRPFSSGHFHIRPAIVIRSLSSGHIHPAIVIRTLSSGLIHPVYVIRTYSSGHIHPSIVIRPTSDLIHPILLYVACYICGKVGHISRNCWFRQDTTNSRQAPAYQQQQPKD